MALALMEYTGGVKSDNFSGTTSSSGNITLSGVNIANRIVLQAYDSSGSYNLMPMAYSSGTYILKAYTYNSTTRNLVLAPADTSISGKYYYIEP